MKILMILFFASFLCCAMEKENPDTQSGNDDLCDENVDWKSWLNFDEHPTEEPKKEENKEEEKKDERQIYSKKKRKQYFAGWQFTSLSLSKEKEKNALEGEKNTLFENVSRQFWLNRTGRPKKKTGTSI